VSDVGSAQVVAGAGDDVESGLDLADHHDPGARNPEAVLVVVELPRSASARLLPRQRWIADSAVNLRRTDAGRVPYDRGISDLGGELSTRSEEFGVRWAKHNVRLHYTGAKSLHHRR
jgi:hypothetical protein